MIVVDRLEGRRAVLEVDGELLEFPRSALPPDVREGDVLTLGIDAAATAAARAPVPPPEEPPGDDGIIDL